MLEAGQPAPEFTARNHLGESVKLSDFSGKHVVLWFYPEADTPGWTIEGEGFRDGIQDFTDRNAVVLGISFDPVEKNRAFAEKYDFPFALLSDPDRTIGMAYHAASSPDQASAKRISYWIGPDGRIRKAYGQVNTRSHPTEVLADIESSLNS